MSHRDTDGRTTSGTSAQDLTEAIGGLLGGIDLTGIRFRSDCGRTAQALVMAGLLWAWSVQQTLRDRFQEGVEGARRLRPRRSPQHGGRCCCTLNTSNRQYQQQQLPR